MYQIVIFDLDGTLLDTLQDLAAACNHALSAMNLPQHPAAAYRFMVGGGIPNLVGRMLPQGQRGVATREVALQLFQNYYAAHSADLTAPYPGIVQMLENLGKSGIIMAIASNKTDNFVQALVGQMFPGVFAQVLGLRDGAPPKPDPAGALALAAAMGAVPEKTLYVGDSDVDMLTAKNAGFASCGVLWGFRPKQELAAAGAQVFAATPGELEAVILGNLP